MKPIEEIKLKNASVGNWVRWKEFSGTKKEREMCGQIIEKRDGHFIVRYSMPATAVVHMEKVVKVTA